MQVARLGSETKRGSRGAAGETVPLWDLPPPPPHRVRSCGHRGCVGLPQASEGIGS